jgi:GTP cyclohydrolase I
VEAFLDALGLPEAIRRGEDLADTPRRVAEAWAEDLVDGYRQDPRDILAEGVPAASRGLVAVTGIDYHSMCPHHLLPSRGVAHVAYLPGARVVGFGQLARLVDCFAHRLVLEEDLARDVAEALVGELGARGAACVLDAEHFCLSVRGERRRDARANAECFVGELEDARHQRRFLQLVGAPAPASAAPARSGRATVAARPSRGERRRGRR